MIDPIEMFNERFHPFNENPEPYTIPNPSKNDKWHLALPIHKFGGEYYAETDNDLKQFQTNEYLSGSNLVGYYYISKADMVALFPKAKRYSEKMNNAAMEYHWNIIKGNRKLTHDDFKSITLDKYGRETP